MKTGEHDLDIREQPEQTGIECRFRRKLLHQVGTHVEQPVAERGHSVGRDRHGAALPFGLRCAGRSTAPA